MDLPDIPPEIGKHFAGPLGSLFALLWIHGTWPRKAAMFAGGVALSFYAAPALSEAYSFSEGFAGFLLGLFGMAAVDKVFAIWQTLELGIIFKKWLYKTLGLTYPEENVDR